MKTLIIILLGCLTFLYAQQPGDLDLSFSSDGMVTTTVGTINSGAADHIIQPDGKIVVVGSATVGAYFDYALARYNSDGTLDNSFSTDGKVISSLSTNDDQAYGVTLQSDGKIIVVGYADNGTDTDIAIARFNSDGSLDLSFGTSGIVIVDINAWDAANNVLVQPNGKILVAGFANNIDFALLRINMDGTPDNSFGLNGQVINPAGAANGGIYDFALQADGKIVVGGSTFNVTNIDFLVVRYNSDGSLDNSFDADGKAMFNNPVDHDVVQALKIQADGKIVVGGYSALGSTQKMMVAKLNTNGSIDSSFDIDGAAYITVGSYGDYLTDLDIQPDNKILVSGWAFNLDTTSQFSVVRLDTGGSLDLGFGNAGKILTSVESQNSGAVSISMQPDGKIVVAGFSGPYGSQKFAITRYLSGLTATIENPLKANSILFYPNPIEYYSTLEYTLLFQENVNIDLYDIQGKLIFTFVKNENQMAGSYSRLIELPSGISSGLYHLVISTRNGSESLKVIK